MVSQNSTAPLYLDLERPFVDLNLLRKDGQWQQERFLVDTGGGTLLLPVELAETLGIPISNKNGIQEFGMNLQKIQMPSISLGNLPLNLHGPAFVRLNDGGLDTEVGMAYPMLSTRLLTTYNVLFDFPSRQFALLLPSSSTPRGVTIRTGIHAQSRFPRIEIEIEGQYYGMLLDTGAGCTMISPAFFDQLVEQHPNWVRTIGAIGSANKGLSIIDNGARMLRVPQIKLGPFVLEGVCVVARQVGGNFAQLAAQALTGPAVGALGGNILKHFRVEIDFEAGTTYLEQHIQMDQHDMDMIGIALSPYKDGTYRITAVSERNNPQVLQSIKTSDSLLQIDGQEVQGRSLNDVVNALRGKPGRTHVLLLKHEGEQFTVNAPTAHIL